MFKVGDKVRIKKTCEISSLRGFCGVILRIEYVDDVDSVDEYPFFIEYINKAGNKKTNHFNKSEIVKFKKQPAHVCGLICKKCKPREVIFF